MRFCVSILLNAHLSEFLPGKRALAIGLCIYHVTCSTVLFNAPRFIPHSFGALAESYVAKRVIMVITADHVVRMNATPERVWGTLHGLVGLGFAVWWQATVQLAAAMRNAMLKSQ